MKAKPKRKLPVNLNEFRKTPALIKPQELGPMVSGDFVGIEIELENLPGVISGEGSPAVTAPLGWTIHRDGSLRNNGAEFVFINPAAGKEIFNRLMSLEEWIKKSKYSPDASKRTSVHVHVDAGDTNTGQMLKWLLLYIIYERILFAEFAPDREQSNFCVPIYNSQLSKQQIGLLVGENAGTATANFLDFYNDIKRDRGTKRYAAVNLDAIQKFGTLEFRHLGGEWKHTPILDWVNVILSMKKWAMDEYTSVKDIFHGPSKMYAETLAYQVFGPVLAGRILANRNFKKLYIEGIRTAQEIYMPNTLPSIPTSIKAVIDAKMLEAKKRLVAKLKSDLVNIKGTTPEKSKNNYMDDYSWTRTYQALDEATPEGENQDGDQGDEAGNLEPIEDDWPDNNPPEITPIQRGRQNNQWQMPAPRQRVMAQFNPNTGFFENVLVTANPYLDTATEAFIRTITNR